tara:strand:- start:4876 stop:5019 length:144 start_codon:yes stop_codon:yes gene_type:complete
MPIGKPIEDIIFNLLFFFANTAKAYSSISKIQIFDNHRQTAYKHVKI